MVKYILQLLADLEQAEKNAPQSFQPFDARFGDEESGDFAPLTKLVNMDDLLGLPAVAFPPEARLEDDHIKLLVFSMMAVWDKWKLSYDLPEKLSERQQYSALRHAWQNELVAWSYENGGRVQICQYEKGTFCPFGEKGSYCHCKTLDEAVKNDIAIWEEHVRSQGLDPYRELSKEEEAAFEKEMRIRQLRKRLDNN